MGIVWMSFFEWVELMCLMVGMRLLGDLNKELIAIFPDSKAIKERLNGGSILKTH